MGIWRGVDDIVRVAGDFIIPGHAAAAAKGGQGKAIFTVRDSDDIKRAVDLFVLWHAYDDGGVRGYCGVGADIHMDDAVVPPDFTVGRVSDLAVYIMVRVCNVPELGDFISELNQSGRPGLQFQYLEIPVANVQVF